MPDAPRPRFSAASVRRFEFLAVAAMVGFVAVLGLVSLWAGAATVWQPMTRLSGGLVLLLLALSGANYVLRGWRWQHFTNGLGLAVPWRRNALYFIAGFAVTTSPGKTGEALRLWFLERCHGLAYERTAPLFVCDRTSDMAAIMIYCLASVGAFSGYLWAAIVPSLLVVAMIVPFLHPPLLDAARKWLERRLARRWPGLQRWLDVALADTARLFTLRLFGFGLLLSLAGWFAEIYEFHLLLAAIGAPLSLQQASFIFTFAMLAGALTMLPGGLGGTEAVMIALLNASGVEIGTAVAATAVIRVTTMWFATLLGMLALPFAMRAARRRDGLVEAAP